MSEAQTFRVMALHALAYCERLFYLEEVEEIRVPDERVWAGRTLHQELDEPGEIVDLTMESVALGVRGRVDALRCRDGSLFPVEHKRGRAKKGPSGPEPWESDRLQALAYALLLAEHAGRSVTEARIRYHQDNVTVRVPVTESATAEVAGAVQRARALCSSPNRPPVTPEERRCVRCSLAPVCLPEETRVAEAAEETGGREGEERGALRLFPADAERRSLHVVTPGAKVGRTGTCLRVTEPEGHTQDVGAREVSDLVVHGHAQVTTQALRLCAEEGIPVHYVTTTGAPIGYFAASPAGVQRRIRQYRALSEDTVALPLARRLVLAKVENELRHVLRASRKDEGLRVRVSPRLEEIRKALRGAARATNRGELMGHEGVAAKAYFASIAELVDPAADPAMRPDGRSRRPPTDRFNALISFGYGMLYRDVLSAVLQVGLDPAFGLLHEPRSSAFPLALDLMELFRTPVVDVAVLGAVNRRTFDPQSDFTITGPQVWLSETGRKKLIEVHERRKHEEYRHTALGYSLSFARHMELEVRLLEKEWSGEAGLFAMMRIR
ncbi:MAG: type I-MYXAN CRISPR-associated endonuclease Cas1 [Deltaproteobacteria bacterium]|nr:type I-MYXAN CRISPR-associated endonuclease Cas1 [Deltaproteobacteria bacterium]